MRDAPKTLDEIRSDACNTILFAATLLAVPTLAANLMRAIEQGWKPVMGVHIGLLILLGSTTLLRRRLGLSLRAAIVTAVPFIIAIGSLLTYGRGNGILMFLVSTCVLAGCFFNRRTVLGVVALCMAALAMIYVGYRVEILTLPVNPTSYDMTVISWLALEVAFFTAVLAPIIALSAVLQSLDAERKRADDAVKIRSNFMASMSHELRTPMVGIIGMADALKATRLDDQQHSLLTKLMLSGRNLLTMLNDLLDFTKFETGHVPIEKLPFRISEIIGNIFSAFEIRAAQKGIGLKLEMPSQFRDEVIGDGFHMSQILSNLVDNAIKFTERGTVVLRIAQMPREDETMILTCAVIDTGIGITPEQIARIFDPFIQAEMSISRTHGGSGLGLAICRKLAHAMGGDIRVTSHPGIGSTFTMELPVQAQAYKMSEPEPEPTTYPAPSFQMNMDKPPISRPLRLLIADDDANMRMLVEIMLPRRGHEVTIVESGAKAVAAANTGTFDCIILDMHMPGIDGPTVMRTIRKSEMEQRLARQTPMIALTADVVPEHVRTFMAAGAHAVVAKPVEWDLLEAKLQEVVGEPAAPQVA